MRKRLPIGRPFQIRNQEKDRQRGLNPRWKSVIIRKNRPGKRLRRKRILPMKQICIGILAHVDAGKTTLSEALLYRAGAIRRLGRVDHQDAFLDTDAMERQRGITIFSKQAVLELGETRVTLLDTPGHVDFSAEAERALQVYAILLLASFVAIYYQSKRIMITDLQGNNDQ